jgi:hypothetical protein
MITIKTVITTSKGKLMASVLSEETTPSTNEERFVATIIDDAYREVVDRVVQELSEGHFSTVKAEGAGVDVMNKKFERGELV